MDRILPTLGAIVPQHARRNTVAFPRQRRAGASCCGIANVAVSLAHSLAIEVACHFNLVSIDTTLVAIEVEAAWISCRTSSWTARPRGATAHVCGTSGPQPISPEARGGARQVVRRRYPRTGQLVRLLGHGTVTAGRGGAHPVVHALELHSGPWREGGEPGWPSGARVAGRLPHSGPCAVGVPMWGSRWYGGL